MTIVLLLPLLVCIVGLLVYVLASNPKVSEMGRIAYGFGLLVTLLVFSTHGVKLL